MKKLFPMILILLFFGCDREIFDRIEQQKETVKQILSEHPQEEVHSSFTRDEFLKGLDLVKIETEDGSELYTLQTSGAKKSAACIECHDRKFERSADSEIAPLKAHWNLTLHHADAQSVNCTSCHASNDKTKLSNGKGNLIAFDRPDKICAQCHFRQVKDWKNGAHGKSVNGWTNPRVIQNCTQCHNPHSPAFPRRFPSRVVKTDPSSF